MVSTKDFIKKCKNIYEDKYSYEFTIYKNNKTKIIINCKEHGIQKQYPKSLYRGIGCNLCSKRPRRTTNSFITEANKIHKNKYDYDLITFTSSNSKVIITCKTHGNFKQYPYNHLSGMGCPKCARNQQSNTKEFIERAKEINGDRYDYSLVDYKTARKKVKIICKKHGEFEQVAHSHLIGKQCKKCSNNVSKKEKEWLNKIERDNNIVLQRQFHIKGVKGNVDGFCKETNTVYEFFGDYYHGNPNKYNSNDLNTKVGKTYGELYNNTMKKINKIKNLKYNIVYIWETEFD